MTPLSHRSLRTQIALAFSVLVAVTAVLISFAFGEWITRDGEREAGRDLQAMARNTARTLAAGLHDRGVQARVMADAEDVWRNGLSSPQAHALLARAQARQAHTVWVGVASVDGTVQAATGRMLVGQSVAQRPWFQKGLAGPFVGDVHKALLLESLLPPRAKDEPARFVDFSAPVHVNGKLLGVLGMHGSWEWTGEVIESVIPPPQERAGLELFIFDRDGQMVYAPPGLLDPLLRAGQRMPAFAPSRAAAQVVEWADGLRTLSAVVQLPARDAVSDLGWQVVARQPLDQAYARSDGVVRRALLVGLAVAIFAALLSWLLARRLSEDLQGLARAAARVKARKQAASIPLLGSSREVHQLSHAMTDMTERLLRANEEMEEQVLLRTRQLEEANAELDRQARTDPLTGLLNRRGFDSQIEFALALASRHMRPLSVATLDVDHFKRINDVYGHAVGDAVLQRIAHLLRERLRESDVVARVGGEEFVALLPDTDSAGAREVAQSLIDWVNATPDPDVGRLTLSAGVASLRGPQDTRSALLQRSDAALYVSKQTGRNRVSVDI